MDIFKLDQALIERYSDFSRSFAEIRAPEIETQIQEAYEGNRFWPDPLVTINPRYEAGKTVGDLAAEGVLDPALSKIFAFGEDRTPFQLHSHQQRAITKAQDGENYIVTTGTGSGKSLCFFIPLIDRIVKARRSGDAPRTRAIIIYPMNALANSQLEELRKFVDESGLDSKLKPTFARYTGQESEERRKEIAAQKPDIILTNFMMLELLMTRQDDVDRQVIANAEGLEFLVLDELHTYRGRQGADVAMLVRRVRQRLASKNDLLCIGTSATMSSAEDEIERNRAVADVGAKLFGARMSPYAIIDEQLARATDPKISSTTLAKSLKDAVETALPAHLTDQDLFQHPLACWIETEMGLQEGEKLRRRPPMTLVDAAKKLSSATNLSQDSCEMKLREMLSIMGMAEESRGGKSDKAFLAFKLHRFISGAGQIFTTLEPAGQRRVELEGQVWHPDDPDARLYPTYFCRECGQEVLSVTFDGLKVIARPIDEVPTIADAGDEPRGGFLVPNINDPFDFDGAVEDYPEDWQEVSAKGQARLKTGRRAQRGELLNLDSSGAVGHDGVPAWFFPGKFQFCPHCKNQPAPQARDRNKLSGLSGEGRSSATTLIVSSILAWMEEDGTLDTHTRKLLGFTDNRQDAALQAGHFNDFIFVTLLRGAVLRAVLSAGSDGLRDIHFGEAVREALGFNLDDANAPRRHEWMIDPNMRGFQSKQDTVDSVTSVLAHRVWADLQRGWRYTNPNLEDAGLIEARFPGLEELVNDDELFASNPHLSSTSPRVREALYAILFNHMRKSLAVATESLDFLKMSQVAESSRQRLCAPWSIDEREQEELRRSGILMIDPPARNEMRRRDADLIVRAGWRTGVAKAMRHKDLWGATLTPDQYGSMISTLISAAEEHQILRRLSTGGEGRGWQLAPSAVRLHPVEVRADAKRANPFFRDLYKHVAQMLDAQTDLPHSFEAREHTAQVDHQVRAWREDRFRYGRDDRKRLEDNKTKMRDENEPNGFLPAMFCSPTMELGVDISSLNTVYLRNAPPTPANYAQRAGRAGRSGQAALVVTYCAAQSPHDQYYFNNRIALVAGVVKPPALDLANKDLLRSHLQAEWLSYSRVPIDPSIPENLDMSDGALDAGLPLDPEKKKILENLSKSGSAKPSLRALLDATIPFIRREDAPWLKDEDAFISLINDDAPRAFNESFDRWRELYRGARREMEEANRIGERTGLQAGERKEAATRYYRATQEIEMLERGQSGNASDFYTYRYLATEGFLPGYNFPRLPLYAFIPATRRHSILQRPRFLAISEFGPNSLVYHEGRAFRVVRAKLPAHGRIDDGLLATRTLILCSHCGAAHDDDKSERCHACGESLSGADRLDNIYRIQNVETVPSVRITANDEDRQRQGFEVQTVFQWQIENDVPDVRRVHLDVGDEALLRLDYGAVARLSRINKGLRRRRAAAICGFMIDPSTGRWKRDSNDDGEEGDVTTSRDQRIVPIVEDRKNALLLIPQRKLDVAQMAGLQHAIIRGAELVFELEEGELLGEPLPTRDERNVILLYEATEGGAGVLNRLVSDPSKIGEVAAAALELMHYKPGQTEMPLKEADHACVAGCYRCLLSYYNQMDHEMIDRRDEELVQYLLDLTTASARDAPDESGESSWQSAIKTWGLPPASSRNIGDERYELFWPSHLLVAVPGGSSDALRASCAELGLDVVSLPLDPPSALPPELASALGVSA